MNLHDTILSAWGWRGFEHPIKIVDSNPFGNLIFTDASNQYWRVCPEELECELIAKNETEYNQLKTNADFQEEWQMLPLLNLAERELGPLTEGRCYCLKTPGVLGGKYDATNLGTLSIKELINFSGNVAEQIKDLPDGSKVNLVIESGKRD